MNFQNLFYKSYIIYESFSWIPDIFCCDKIEREECNISVLPRKYNTWQYQPDGYFYWVITRTLDIYDNKYSILTIILFRPTLCVSQEKKHFETNRWPPSPSASRFGQNWPDWAKPHTFHWKKSFTNSKQLHQITWNLCTCIE